MKKYCAGTKIHFIFDHNENVYGYFEILIIDNPQNAIYLVNGDTFEVEHTIEYLSVHSVELETIAKLNNESIYDLLIDQYLNTKYPKSKYTHKIILPK